MNINITTSECHWSCFQVQILTRNIRGLRGFSADKELETDYLYGAGGEPLDITEGNRKYPGNLKVLGFEADAMNAIAAAAGYGDITEVPHELIVISIQFKRRPTDKLKSYVATGVKFEKTGISMEQGAKHRETDLPFKAMGLAINTL